MTEIIKLINRKINGLAFTFVSTAVALALLAATIVWIPMAVQVFLGVLVLIVAFGFAYFGCKLLSIKREIEKILKF